MGEQAEVISPGWFRDRIKERIHNMFEKYFPE